MRISDWSSDVCSSDLAFNGNLFKAPCAFEADSAHPPKVQPKHLSVLARFRHGHENMATHQLRFWGYDFRYMSIGLISAVYDRFLKEEAEKKDRKSTRLNSSH